MSVTTLADVRALVATDLGYAELQTVIDREEAALTAKYGAPAGSRTTTVHGAGPVISLGRPIATVASVKTAYSDAASETVLDPSTYMVYPALGTIRRRRAVGPIFPSDYVNGEWSWDWLSETVVVWTPVDFTGQFTQATIDLVRLTLARTAYTSENIGMGQLQYQQPNWEGERNKVLDRLLAPGPRFA